MSQNTLNKCKTEEIMAIFADNIWYKRVEKEKCWQDCSKSKTKFEDFGADQPKWWSKIDMIAKKEKELKKKKRSQKLKSVKN